MALDPEMMEYLCAHETDFLNRQVAEINRQKQRNRHELKIGLPCGFVFIVGCIAAYEYLPPSSVTDDAKFLAAVFVFIMLSVVAHGVAQIAFKPRSFFDELARERSTPALAHSLLVLLPQSDREIVHRDLDEQLAQDRSAVGSQRARKYYRLRAAKNVAWFICERLRKALARTRRLSGL